RLYSDNVTPDLDGNGKLDVVFGYPYGSNHTYLTVGLGDGTGHFVMRDYVAAPGPNDSSQAGADGANPVSVLVHDFDGDGQQDVAVGSFGNGYSSPGGVSILFGAGNGILRAPRVFPTAFPATQSNQNTPLALGDFTGDGKT